MAISAYYMPFTPPFLSSVIAGTWLQVASFKLRVESLRLSVFSLQAYMQVKLIDQLTD